MKRSPQSLTGAALLVALALGSSPARATNYWKNSVVTGNWSTGNNWSATSAAGVDNAGAPTIGEAVNIVFTDGTARTVTYDVAATSIGLLSIDLTGAGATSATLSLPNNNNLATNGIAVGGYSGAALTNGRGSLSQSGGNVTTNAVVGDLVLGFGVGSTGTYTLSGGAFVNNLNEYIGFSGTGTFNHTAGTNTINASAAGFFSVGHNPNSVGTYNLSGAGALVANTSEYVGNSGSGFFNQIGGSNTVGSFLNLANTAGSTGTYLISGTGTLTTGSAIVGNSGTGTLMIQDQASVDITNNLSINSLSTVNLNGGTLRFDTVTGINRLVFNSGTVQLGGNRIVGGAGDPTIAALFGGNPVIPGGKSLTVEGLANALTLTIDGGRFRSFSTLHVGLSPNSTLTIGNGGVATSVDGLVGSSFGNAFVTVSGPGSVWNITNNLTLGNLGGGFLTIRDQGLISVDNLLDISSGRIDLQGGTLRLNTITGLNNVVFDSGTIQLSGSRTIGGSSGDSIVAHFFGASPGIPIGKGLTVEETATILSATTIDGGTLTAGVLANARLLDLRRGTLNLTNQILTIDSTGPFGNTFDVNNDMTVNVTFGITNQGLVTGDGQMGGTFNNTSSGELRGEPGRSLKLTGANNTNAGRMNLLGGELEFTQNLTNNVGALISGNGTLITHTGMLNQGTMNFGGTTNVLGDVTNAVGGKIISGGGGATIFLDDVTNQGEIRTSANGFTIFYGSVSGAGTFTGTGTVNFEGDLTPGNSPATVSFGGNMSLGPDSVLKIEIGGAAPGTQYDQINVTGTLSLGGTLQVSFIKGFVPAAGQSFDLLNWGSLAGTFSSIQLPALSGLAWNTSQLASGLLSVVLAGDYNHNGVVNATDYVVWRKGLGTSYTQNDYTLWRANFGQTAGSGSGATSNAAVPEPPPLVLLVFAVAGWCLRRGRAA